jgi:predicted CXXCH cytochrome family protein
MKSMTAKLLLTLAFAFAAPFVWGAAGDPGTGIPATTHDFSGVSIAGVGGRPAADTGTCTFCHTPHKASSQALLWNQAANTPAAYTWTNPATTGSTDYATITSATNTGPSVKCLSCHDGSAGVGDIGWFNAQDPATTLPAPGMTADFTIGPGGDMDGNHPTSMPFPLAGAANTYNGTTNGAAAAASDWIADPEALGIRLFNDSTGTGTGISAGAVAGTTGIECSSCHDPHNGGSVEDVFFLRGDLGGNAATYICAKCHNR